MIPSLLSAAWKKWLLAWTSQTSDYLKDFVSTSPTYSFCFYQIVFPSFSFVCEQHTHSTHIVEDMLWHPICPKYLISVSRCPSECMFRTLQFFVHIFWPHHALFYVEALTRMLSLCDSSIVVTWVEANITEIVCGQRQHRFDLCSDSYRWTI